MPADSPGPVKTQNYKLLYERSPLGYQSLDENGNFIIVNPAWCELLGYSKDEVIGKWFGDFMTAESQKKVLENFPKFKKTGKICGIEFDMLRKDGKPLLVSFDGRIGHDEQGNFTQTHCILQNLTEKKKVVEIEESYANIFENSLNEIFVFDAETFKFIKVNHGACHNIGYSTEELYQLTPLDIKPELTVEIFNQLVEPLLSGVKEIVQFESIHKRKDGSLYNAEVHLQLTHFLSKPAYVAIVLDVTDRKLAEKKLQLFGKVFSETNEGIIITDANGIIIDNNPAFCDITGYSREEIIGQNPSVLSSGKQSPMFYAEMWDSLNKNGDWQGEVWNRTKSGNLYAELLTISSILDDDKNVLHYIGIFTDITDSKKQQETLEKMAHYDVLTQLPNRVLLADRFSQALAHSKRQDTLLAVCFLDLDNFKPVNDIYGHEVGDKLLIEVAERIQFIIREEDTVSRQGGDEFALLLGDIESFSQCEHILKRIIDSLAKPYFIDQQTASIGASIGVSLYPTEDSDLDTLMRHADQAMYQAKLAGKNRYHLFNAEQNQLETQKNIKLKEIQQALVNNELSLYYQPKVNMVTGEVFGAEALIRWIHPEKGIIPPLDFLPVIAETELEIQVGNWVIHKALQQLDNWKSQGIELELSINIASYHLESTSFIADLGRALSLFPKVHSKRLQLEILESSVMGDLNIVSNIAKICINTLGVNIALDDFGTGYSSLTHLRNLPVQTIKIDQSFVRDILDDPSDHAIIDSVIGLAGSFNRSVIAEGVETTEHGIMLILMGCNKAQGYSIAKPMPESDLKKWLINYSPNQLWLAYANKELTEKQKKIAFFKLSFEQWVKHFKNNLHSAPGTIEQWPILKRTKCHCGVWIKRARQEQIVDEKLLAKLSDAHNTFHDIADELFKKYQQGHIEAARVQLDTFDLTAERLKHIVELCE